MDEEEDCDFFAVAVQLQDPLCWLRHVPSAVDAFDRSSLPLSTYVSSERRRCRLPPGRLVAQRCMKTGWCVPSSLSATRRMCGPHACGRASGMDDEACTRIPCSQRWPPSRPPAPQSSVEPRAMNSGSLNTSVMGPLTAMLKSPPTKSTSSRTMCAHNRRRSDLAAFRRLATTLRK